MQSRPQTNTRARRLRAQSAGSEILHKFRFNRASLDIVLRQRLGADDPLKNRIKPLKSGVRGGQTSRFCRRGEITESYGHSSQFWMILTFILHPFLSQEPETAAGGFVRMLR